MKESVYKNYDEARVLGVSPSSGYELMHEPDFPVLRVGSRMLVPKEKFIRWAEEHTLVTLFHINRLAVSN